VFARIGSKLYYGIADDETGKFAIKTQKIIKGSLVTLICKVGLKYSLRVVVRV